MEDLWEIIKDALFDKAEGFTCSEADAIVDFAHERGEHQFAEAFAEAHAAGDEEGDSHYD